jgi:hypothetical protein
LLHTINIYVYVFIERDLSFINQYHLEFLFIFLFKYIVKSFTFQSHVDKLIDHIHLNIHASDLVWNRIDESFMISDKGYETLNNECEIWDMKWQVRNSKYWMIKKEHETWNMKYEMWNDEWWILNIECWMLNDKWKEESWCNYYWANSQRILSLKILMKLNCENTELWWHQNFRMQNNINIAISFSFNFFDFFTIIKCHNSLLVHSILHKH